VQLIAQQATTTGSITTSVQQMPEQHYPLSCCHWVTRINWQLSGGTLADADRQAAGVPSY
jgi:hypothetical protein